MSNRDKSKLNINQEKRLQVFNAAGGVFIDEQLRQAEDEAFAKLEAAIDADIQAIPLTEWKALKKYDLILRVDRIEMPFTMRLRAEKEFEMPDGSSVRRDADSALYHCPDGRDFVGPGEFRKVPRLRGWSPSSSGYGRQPDRSYPLTKHRYMPLSLGRSKLEFVSAATGDWLPKGHPGGLKAYDLFAKVWIGQATLDAARDFYIAAVERSDKERLMLKAMYQLLVNCKTFRDVCHVWPEAQAMEDELFADVPMKNLPVVVDQEAMAALCENMDRRGVASQACKLRKAS
jgi:hypothetical protein